MYGIPLMSLQLITIGKFFLTLHIICKILECQQNGIFSSYHGKSPYDGLGGTLKRFATKASLQRPCYNQIMKPRHLFEWAESALSNVSVIFVTEE